MDFTARATMEFLAGLGSENDATDAYEKMQKYVFGDDDGEELDEDIIIWQPFENFSVEDIINLIDSLANKFENIYNEGVTHGESK